MRVCVLRPVFNLHGLARRHLSHLDTPTYDVDSTCVQLLLSTALELSMSSFQPPGDRGSKAASEDLCATLAGVSGIEWPLPMPWRCLVATSTQPFTLLARFL